jgi:hypothetical protein
LISAVVGGRCQYAGMEDVLVGRQAVAAGRLTRHELQRWYRPIYRGVYVPKQHELSLRDRTVGALLTCRRRAVVGGIAASALQAPNGCTRTHLSS